MIPRSWTGPVAWYDRCRRRVAGCADCEEVRPLIERGLCGTCLRRNRAHGTVTQFGYVKADRLADYAALRQAGTAIMTAAARLGVSERTGQRYEAELAASGQAPWRERTGGLIRAA